MRTLYPILLFLMVSLPGLLYGQVQDDAVPTDEDTDVTFSVTDNDNVPDIDIASVDLDPSALGRQLFLSVAGEGDLSVDDLGNVTFEPDPDFFGVVTRSYSVNNTFGDEAGQAEIVITVNAVNDAPVAVDDAGTTDENTPVSIVVTSNDTDVDDVSDDLSADLDPSTGGIQTSWNVVGEGAWTASGGTVTFTPEADFIGTAQLIYTAWDPGGAESNDATITVTVNAVNASPVATDDATTTDADTPVTISILTNDTDDDDALDETSVDLDPVAPGQQASISLTEGSAAVDGSGVVTFTPSVGFTGSITFNYTVADDAGNISNIASVTITVNAVNTPPAAADDAATTNADTPVAISILANDTDDGEIEEGTVDLDPGTAGQQATITVTGGSAVVDASGVVTFTPSPGYTGTAQFTYTVNDNTATTSNTATVTVTVNAVNAPPIATNDAGSTSEGTDVSFDIVGNDTDPDGTIDPTSVDLDPASAGQQTSFTHANGAASVDNTGMFTFTPDAGFVGTVIISYTVSDNEGAASDPAQITVTVSAGNQAPVATNDNINGTEDTSFNFDLLANDTDDNQINAASVDLDPSANGQQTALSVTGGTITVNASGVISYTPVADYNGSFSFSYTVEDDQGLESNSATVSVVIAAVNDAPVAVADAASTTEETPVSFNIVANDTDVDGTIDPATVDLDVSAAGIQNTRTTPDGTYTVDGAGIVTFTPAENFSGPAAIQYNVRDNLGLLSNDVGISVNVAVVNDAPLAADDATVTDENQSVAINILTNDSDDNSLNPASVDLDPGTAGIQNTLAVTGGTFSVNASGLLTFLPTVDYSGTVAISYTVNDNEGATSNVAAITVTVNAVNQKPVASPDLANTDEDVPVNINVVANDTDDASIDPATVDLNVSVAGIQNTRTTPQGSYTVDAAGTVTFTPAANFSGTATIQYTVNDQEGMTSDPVSITVEVANINDKPVATNDAATIDEDTNAVINIIANDTDPDGSIVASSVDLDLSTPGIQSSLTVAEGVLSVAADGVLTFVPLNNFFGTVTTSYAVNDNEGATSDPATISITVNAVNDPPIANNDVANTPQNVPVTINILSNDLDVDGTISAPTVDLLPSTPLVADKTRTVANGTYTVDVAGVITFTPVPAFSGTSSITYTVQDNLGATSNSATISVLVDFVNSPPVATDDAATTAEDTPVTLNVLTNDTDDGTLVVSSVDLNTSVEGIQTTRTTPQGTFSVSSGTVTFTPVLNFNGTATNQYTVEDDVGVKSNAATITITVTPVNDAPVANNDNATTTEDTPVGLNVIANDTDVDGTLDPATVDLQPATEEVDATRSVEQGTFTVTPATGVVTFTPAESVFGSATISYNVRDNSGAKSNNATITVTITNVNNPPVFNEIPNQRVLRNAGTKTISITGISAGPQESEQVLLSAVSANTTLMPHPSITYDGFGTTATLTYQPQINQTGSAEVTVKAVDAGLNEFTRTFTIEVIDVSITSTPPTVAVTGENYQYNITTTDLTETLEIVALQKPAWATLTSTGKNQAVLEGIPPADATNTTVVIQLKDGNSVVDQQDYLLTINRRPTSADFGMETVEDTPLSVGAENFILSYSDPDNHPLYEIFFTALPRHGTLALGQNAVSAEQLIPAAELSGLVYTPGPDYAGPDTLYFKVRDQYSASAEASYVHFVITPVNDAPRITFLESQPLEVDIGREVPYALTAGFTAEDPEGDEIVSAEIGFRRPNFNGLHDLLTFDNTPKIKGVYDDALGILTLTGAASVAEYEEAIRSVTYTFANLQEIILDPRTVYVVLSDASAASEPGERELRLVFNFVDLKVPQVFTPDGNGMNDLWPFASEDGLEPWNDATIRVFDQRGSLVFDALGFGSPWDGKKDGSYVPKGTYFYVIDMQYGKISYTGSVTILRDER